MGPRHKLPKKRTAVAFKGAKKAKQEEDEEEAWEPDPLPVVNKVSARSCWAIEAAMSVVKPSADFVERGVAKPDCTKNFVIEDRSATYQSSILRVRRPMSVKFAQKVVALYDVILDEEDFDIKAEFGDDDFTTLVELMQAYQVAKMDVPTVLKERFEECRSSGGIRKDAGLRREFSCVVGPVDSDPFPEGDPRGPAHIYTAYPTMNTTQLEKLDQLSKEVYGVKLSTLTAPLLFLHNHANLGAENMKALLGLVDTGDEPSKEAAAALKAGRGKERDAKKSPRSNSEAAEALKNARARKGSQGEVTPETKQQVILAPQGQHPAPPQFAYHHPQYAYQHPQYAYQHPQYATAYPPPLPPPPPHQYAPQPQMLMFRQVLSPPSQKEGGNDGDNSDKKLTKMDLV